jgi:CRP-like cAMP-binding protein
MRIVKCDGRDPQSQAAYKLRYSVYGQEMPLRDELFDHKNQLITDAIDPISLIYIGYDSNNRVIATLRATKISDYSPKNNLPISTQKLLELSRFSGDYAQKTVVASQFVVKSENRGSLISYKIIEAAYLNGMFQGQKFVLVYCDPYLIGMYIQIGFRIFSSPMIDKYAYYTPLILVGHDWEYFRKIGSPLIRSAQKNGIPLVSDESVDWFYTEFGKSIEDRKSSLSSREVTEMLFHAFGSNIHADRSPKITEGLDKAEVELLISFCRTIKCFPGEMFIQSGQVTQEMYILIRGQMQVESMSDRNMKASLGPGQVFGEISLLLNTPRSANCRTMTDCHIAIMSLKSFNQLVQRQPILANKILLNLAKTLSYRLLVTNNN